MANPITTLTTNPTAINDYIISPETISLIKATYDKSYCTSCKACTFVSNMHAVGLIGYTDSRLCTKLDVKCDKHNEYLYSFTKEGINHLIKDFEKCLARHVPFDNFCGNCDQIDVYIHHLLDPKQTTTDICYTRTTVKKTCGCIGGKWRITDFGFAELLKLGAIIKQTTTPTAPTTPNTPTKQYKVNPDIIEQFKSVYDQPFCDYCDYCDKFRDIRHAGLYPKYNDMTVKTGTICDKHSDHVYKHTQDGIDRLFKNLEQCLARHNPYVHYCSACDQIDSYARNKLCPFGNYFIESNVPKTCGCHGNIWKLTDAGFARLAELKFIVEIESPTTTTTSVVTNTANQSSATTTIAETIKQLYAEPFCINCSEYKRNEYNIVFAHSPIDIINSIPNKNCKCGLGLYKFTQGSITYLGECLDKSATDYHSDDWACGSCNQLRSYEMHHLDMLNNLYEFMPNACQYCKKQSICKPVVGFSRTNLNFNSNPNNPKSDNTNPIYIINPTYIQTMQQALTKPFCDQCNISANKRKIIMRNCVSTPYVDDVALRCIKHNKNLQQYTPECITYLTNNLGKCIARHIPYSHVCIDCDQIDFHVYYNMLYDLDYKSCYKHTDILKTCGCGGEKYALTEFALNYLASKDVIIVRPAVDKPAPTTPSATSAANNSSTSIVANTSPTTSAIRSNFTVDLRPTPIATFTKQQIKTAFNSADTIIDWSDLCKERKTNVKAYANYVHEYDATHTDGKPKTYSEYYPDAVPFLQKTMDTFIANLHKLYATM